MQGSTAASAQAHDRAPGTHDRAPPVHGRAPGARLDVHWCAGFVALLLGRAPLRHTRACPVFCWFAILDARGFLEPLIFLEIAREIFISIKI